MGATILRPWGRGHDVAEATATKHAGYAAPTSVAMQKELR